MAERLIHILPEQVASQIAAGEVVERPASAVKELVENSLDAGASWVLVELGRGGCELIAVGDDGCGMGREDAALSLRRHATSKIRGVSDLAAISTLGFRGEALASIASVSRFKMWTRRAGELSGIELMAQGGELEQSRQCAIAPGTRVEVRNLFFNTPARLKFLKAPATEQGAVVETLQRLALANPRVSFRLVADGREVLGLARASSVLERMRQIFGARIASRMLPFALKRGEMEASGLAGMSQESYPTARLVFTYVNGRPVRDRLLLRAVGQAYQTLLPRGRHPAAILFIELPAEAVDVNVHPMKTEVRFRHSGAVFELVYQVLRGRLARQEAEAGAAQEIAQTEEVADSGSRCVISPVPSAPVQEEVRTAGPSREDARLKLVAEMGGPSTGAEQRAFGLGFASRAEAGEVREADSSARQSGPWIPRYSELKIVGQLFAGYIALESERGLILVDQHAAHERVTFEKLRSEQLSGGIRVQALLTPQAVELDAARAAQVKAAIPRLRAVGFDVEPFGAATLVLKGAPAVFGASDGGKLLTDMIDSMVDSGIEPANEQAFEDWLKQLACHGSVRVGRLLNELEMRELLVELDRTEFKTNCPHGRPVHIEFGRGQIERMFRR